MQFTTCTMNWAPTETWPQDKPEAYITSWNSSRDEKGAKGLRGKGADGKAISGILVLREGMQG